MLSRRSNRERLVCVSAPLLPPANQSPSVVWPYAAYASGAASRPASRHAFLRGSKTRIWSSQCLVSSFQFVPPAMTTFPPTAPQTKPPFGSGIGANLSQPAPRVWLETESIVSESKKGRRRIVVMSAAASSRRTAPVDLVKLPQPAAGRLHRLQLPFHRDPDRHRLPAGNRLGRCLEFQFRRVDCLRRGKRRALDLPHDEIVGQLPAAIFASLHIGRQTGFQQRHKRLKTIA